MGERIWDQCCARREVKFFSRAPCWAARGLRPFALARMAAAMAAAVRASSARSSDQSLAGGAASAKAESPPPIAEPSSSRLGRRLQHVRQAATRSTRARATARATLCCACRTCAGVRDMLTREATLELAAAVIFGEAFWELIKSLSADAVAPLFNSLPGLTTCCWRLDLGAGFVLLVHGDNWQDGVGYSSAAEARRAAAPRLLAVGARPTPQRPTAPAGRPGRRHRHQVPPPLGGGPLLHHRHGDHVLALLLAPQVGAQGQGGAARREAGQAARRARLVVRGGGRLAAALVAAAARERPARPSGGWRRSRGDALDGGRRAGGRRGAGARRGRKGGDAARACRRPNDHAASPCRARGSQSGWPAPTLLSRLRALAPCPTAALERRQPSGPSRHRYTRH